ncbi:hypothetical protein KHM83_16805 [Fusibacter paucivorans]|uniref:Uncharacterized protein n=1 Tax=Fusibacter paucivorans TaxID=76009 RepID=A0ABS5PV62_9FIRM|nr:hypothetical protein [Fusibacter paucivorans]MBS7528351.1 hypothetical protein [Fusibacter paucivorans]
MAFDETSKLKDLLADEKAAAVIEKHFPGTSKHPQLGMIKNFPLKTIAGFPQAGIKPEQLKEAVAELKTL